MVNGKEREIILWLDQVGFFVFFFFFLKCLNLIFSLTFFRAEGSPGWPQLHMISC